MMRLLFLVIGYLFGILETGYLYGKHKNRNLQKEGSGNFGATNAARVLGKKAGALVLVGDCLKSLIPCLLVRILFSEDPNGMLYVAWMGLGTVLGHDFPFYLKFSGGKGVATSFGFALAWDPVMSIPLVLIFGALVLTTGYVSLGSMIGAVSYALILFVKALIEAGGEPLSPQQVESFILIGVIVGLMILRHRANIQRLVAGKENRFDFSTPHGKK